MAILRRKRDSSDTVDLREGARWGWPTACPSCGGRGYLDRVDLVREVMQQHCLDCGTEYVVHKSDLELQSGSGAS